MGKVIVGRCQHSNSVQTAFVDVDAKWLVSASADRQLMVCDLTENKLLGNTIALAADPQGVSRVASDRIRVVMAGERITEYKLIPIPSFPEHHDLRASVLDDEAAARKQVNRELALLPINTVVARSPNRKIAIRMAKQSEIEAMREDSGRLGGTLWRREMVSPVLRIHFEKNGDVLVAQTDSFTTEVLNSNTGERIGSAIEERRLFGDDVKGSEPLASYFGGSLRPAIPLASDLGAARNLLLTRSFFWDPPNLGYYWFTVWDIESGLPLIDVERGGEAVAKDEDSVLNYAYVSPDQRFLFLEGDDPNKTNRSILLLPTPELRAILPKAAEAFGGLKVESDGSFTVVPDRLRIVNSFLDLWSKSIKHIKAD
ncbi:MAG TPA: hypothetical protein VGN12_05050 [Pirellulales bacterium]|jgi:hypothetical protein